MTRIEEIFFRINACLSYGEQFFHGEQVKKAMADYAKELAIGFAEWILKKGFKITEHGTMWQSDEWIAFEYEKYTSEQLFDLYVIQSKTKEP